MPKTCLGIQITPSRTVSVRLKGGLKTAVVDQVQTHPFPATDAQARAETLERLEFPAADTVVASLGADAIFHRIVQVPFTDRRKAEQAAPLEAEDSLPLPLEQLVGDLHPLSRDSRHTRLLYVCAPEERVRERLEELRHAGLNPRILDAAPMALTTVARAALGEPGDVLLLDLDPDRSMGVALGEEGPFWICTLPPGDQPNKVVAHLTRHLRRWEEEGFTPQTVYLSGPLSIQTDLSAWSTALGLDAAQLPFPNEAVTRTDGVGESWPGWAVGLGLALREFVPKRASRINLRKGRFAPAQATAQWRSQIIRAGIYAGILVLLWGGSIWMEASRTSSRLEALEDSIRVEFAKVRPGVPTEGKNVDVLKSMMANQVAELEERASTLGSLMDKEVSPLRILREISGRIPNELEVEFREFNAEGDRVRIEGITTSFDAIDKFKAQLADHPRFTSLDVSDAKAGVDPNKVIFKMTIDLGGPEG